MAGERQPHEGTADRRTAGDGGGRAGASAGAGPDDERALEPGAPTTAAGVSRAEGPLPTNAGRVWVTLAVSLVVLVALIIFIAQNTREVTVNFLGLHGTIATGLALLIAAVAGAIITVLAGTARILQLRSEVRKRHGRR